MRLPPDVTRAKDHPNLARGPFLRALARLQNANLARGICVTRIDFTRGADGADDDGLVALTVGSPQQRNLRGTQRRLGEITVRVTVDDAGLVDQLHPFGPWAPPAGAWFPLGIDPEPTDPLQVYTDLMHEIGDHAAVLRELYPGTVTTLDLVTLSGPRDATIGLTTPNGTRCEAIVSLTDPAALVGIDFSLAEWIHTRIADVGTSDPGPDEACVIRTDWR